MSLAVVQSTSNWQVHPSAQTVTFGTAPTSGNLLLAMSTNWNPPTAGTGWTLAESVGGSSFDGVYIWYKYAGSGESATQTISNDTDRDIVTGAWEISGVAGTWASDFQGYTINAANFGGPTFDTNAYTTTAAAVLFTMIAGLYNIPLTGDHTPTTTGTDDVKQTTTGGATAVSHYYPATFSHKAFSSGVSAVVTGTFPETPTTNFAFTAAVALNGSAGGTPVKSTPGLGTLTLTGYAPTAASPGQAHPGVGTLALTGFAPHIIAAGHPNPGVLALTGFGPRIIATGYPGTPQALTITGHAPLAAPPAIPRITNAGLLTLVNFLPPSRVTNMGLLAHGLSTGALARVTNMGAFALAETDNKTRATNMGLLVLAKGAPAPITPQPLNLPSSQRSKIVNQRLVNMYYEPTPDGPAGDARFGRGGLVSAAQRGGGPVYAVFGFNGFTYSVSGTSVFRDGDNIGTIEPGPYVRWATSLTEVVLVSGGQAYYVTEMGATVMADLIPGYKIADVIFTAAGQFVYITTVGRWYWSNVGDARTVGALSFASAEAYPYNLVGAVNLDDTFVLMTTGHAEFWYGTGSTDTPYQREQGRIYTKGLLAVETLIQTDNTAFFLGSDRIVYRMGAEPMRVSTFDVENYIRKVSDKAIGSSWAFTTFSGGHVYYVLSLPEGQGTWAFDISQNRWSEWKSFGRDNFRVRSAFGATLGDQYGGNLMALDAEVFTDLGTDPLERIVGTYLPIKSGALKNFNLMVASIRGVGNVGIPNPHVEMRFSDSEGRYWTDWQTAPLGPQGIADDSAKAIWYDLGALKAPGRLFEFRVTDPVEFTPYMVKFNEVRM